MRKKRLNPKKRTSRSKARKQVSRLRRFLSALTVSAVATFSIVSYALNPQLHDQFSLDLILSRLDLPRQEQAAPQVVDSGARVQTRFVDCPQFFPDGKPPLIPPGPALRELCFSSFAILHSGKTKTPVFVAQHLNRQILTRTRSVQRTDRFYTEARLPSSERAELADYRGSGYSRGHMAPAGDMHNPEAMAQSFSLANMVPQNQTHNAGAWNRIENDTRKYVMRAKGDVYVFTGPVYASGPKTIGPGRVAVPTHLYKLVYDATTGRAWAHWQANSADTRPGPPLSYEEFARRTGLRLLSSYR